MADRVGSGVDRERGSASAGTGKVRSPAPPEPSLAPRSPYALPRRGGSGTSSRTDFLGAVPMLTGLSDALRRKLAARSTWVTVPAGEWLFRKGDEGDSLYVVNTGRLEVVIEESVPEVARVLAAGSVVGELALLTREPRSASVRARRVRAQ